MIFNLNVDTHPFFFLVAIIITSIYEIWCEPYQWANSLAPDGTFTAEFTKWIKEERNLPDEQHLPSGGYQASKYPFSWVKQQLETGHTSRALVFVKDICNGITGHYDAIPRGFKHSFLIRHPFTVFQSWKKMNSRAETDVIKKDDEFVIGFPELDFFKRSVDLYHHVKANYDSNPVVIDADDLQNSPADILRAYCNAVDIPYSESLLTWPSGQECMEKRWMIAKEFMYIHNRGGIHLETFASTGFQKPPKLPEKGEMTERDLIRAKDSMKYYKELYELRLNI